MREPVKFGKYVLLERVSVGGMAEVFKAKAFGVEGFERIIAIKRILPSLAEDMDFIEMFIDEAKICGQLNHANVCQIFELGRVDESHFIAMEYVWGKDLLQIQNRFRKQRLMMRPDMGAFIGSKLCEGLDYAHKKKDTAGKSLGIIHRDVSPQNILISYDGELKIIDFGIAKAASRSSKTQAGVLKGKFGYMSPEQVRGLPLDHRSDIFAIGTILYELLSGGRLFVGESDFETLERVRNAEVVPLSQRNPAVPPRLEKIIHKALSKDVDGRFQWASEMQEALHSFVMDHDPVFTTKNLSSWMREQFAPEMKREQQVLDEQRRFQKGDHKSTIAGHFQPERPSLKMDTEEMAPANFAEEDVEEKTMVSTPDFLEETHLEGSGRRKAAIAPPVPPPAPSDSMSITKPRREGAVRKSGLISKQATILTGEAPPDVAQAATLYQSVNEVAPTPSPSATPTISEFVRTATGTGHVLPVENAGKIKREYLIAAFALVIGVCGFIGYRYASHSKSKGTLVIVNPHAPAEIQFDGQPRGHIDEGASITIKDIAPGVHDVLLSAKDGAQFAQSVTVHPGDVSVLTANLRAPTRTGRLKLTVKPVDAQVTIDGKGVEGEVPLVLIAGVAHEVRITKEMKQESRFSITLKEGEEQDRTVELASVRGMLRIETEPPAADVLVNGRRSGQSPLVLKDLDTSAPVRISVRHRGYSPMVRIVDFAKGLEQALEFKMTPEEEFLVDDAPSGAKPSAVIIPPMPKTVPTPPAPKTVVVPPAPPTSDDDLAPVKMAAPTPKSGGSEPGFLLANTKPWAKIIIDGKDTGKTTPISVHAKLPLPPGKHVVTFQVNGKKFNFDVVIKSAEDYKIFQALE